MNEWHTFIAAEEKADMAPRGGSAPPPYQHSETSNSTDLPASDQSTGHGRVGGAASASPPAQQRSTSRVWSMEEENRANTYVSVSFQHTMC
jgi:hypothetical protein